MNKLNRSVTLQTRGTPGLKREAAQVLHGLGLTTSKAVELFLHRLIFDEKLPFDVVALDEATSARIIARPTQDDARQIGGARRGSAGRTP